MGPEPQDKRKVTMNKIERTTALTAAETAATAARFTLCAIDDISHAITALEADPAVPFSATNAIREACERAWGHARATDRATCETCAILEKKARR